MELSALDKLKLGHSFESSLYRGWSVSKVNSTKEIGVSKTVPDLMV